MQLSKTENFAYKTLKENNIKVFKLGELSLLLNFNKTKSYNIIKSLKKKGAINSHSFGVYSLSGVDDFAVGAYLNHPSYLSFLSALNYYGFSDNLPRKLTFVSTKYKKSKQFEYVCLAKNRFFGYKKEGEIVIAEKEKAIVDSLLFPKYSGGIKEVSKVILENLDELDTKKLLDYSLRVRSKMVLRRLGFILDKKLGAKDEQVLIRKIGKGIGFLDPSIKNRKELNKRWLLYTSLE